MRAQSVSFSIVNHAAWAPGLVTPEAWAEWSGAPGPVTGEAEPGVRAMPAMLRRRAGLFGKMALEAAYQCMGGDTGIPVVFSSRHGDVARALELLTQLARGEALSPTAFGMAVHNATAGLFSIARAERCNHIALAAGASSLEHAVIEACGLLADGAPRVLLVAGDCPLPREFAHFEDCAEQPHAFAWLMAPAGEQAISLSWRGAGGDAASDAASDAAPDAPTLPGGLDVLRFHIAGDAELVRTADRRTWRWSRDA
ncbi:beta-ketoacyl synthase chain length factor [Pseudoduganella namucuonensis]|uniref:Beta-ketoacyl synthase, N-terminal domain n=1 Tax=Pseudoduganella namucuonensis TaxID=1035707 RepID=A0A1I7IX90_9BURK|nr:beta-ketoacyl synthase chain length factor [Pseudoduganella namucuonensis]SFU77451.1 Beta-ketoacyl synthase, N-terminal domain [Pseudoduganella namucuonensis]